MDHKDDLKFKIDLRKSIPENALFYYETSKKLKKKIKGARNALQKTQEAIARLSKKVAEKAVTDRPQRKTKRKWYEKFRNFQYDKFLIIGGKDTITNEILIKKYLEPYDLVFHADIVGSPFFIIKYIGNGISMQTQSEIPKEVRLWAAQLAASYSKAWRLGMASCDVYSVRPEQVSKSAPSGEYLKRGAFMISGKREWFRNVRLEIAIGFLDRVIAGPPSMVSKMCKSYVTIIPGDIKSKEISKDIKKHAMRKAGAELGRKIKDIPLDEIQRLIPAGRGRVLVRNIKMYQDASH